MKTIAKADYSMLTQRKNSSKRWKIWKKNISICQYTSITEKKRERIQEKSGGYSGNKDTVNKRCDYHDGKNYTTYASRRWEFGLEFSTPFVI